MGQVTAFCPKSALLMELKLTSSLHPHGGPRTRVCLDVHLGAHPEDTACGHTEQDGTGRHATPNANMRTAETELYERRTELSRTDHNNAPSGADPLVSSSAPVVLTNNIHAIFSCDRKA